MKAAGFGESGAEAQLGAAGEGGGGSWNCPKSPEFPPNWGGGGDNYQVLEFVYQSVSGAGVLGGHKGDKHSDTSAGGGAAAIGAFWGIWGHFKGYGGGWGFWGCWFWWGRGPPQD